MYYMPLATDELFWSFVFILSVYAVIHFSLYVVHLKYIAPLYVSPKSDGIKLIIFLVFFAAGTIYITLMRDLGVYIETKTFAAMDHTFSILGFQQMYWSYYSTTWVMVVSGAVFFLYRWKTNRENIRLLNEDIAQSKVLFHSSQMNPHFLFNAINNICGILSHQPEQVPVLFDKLRGLMQYTFEQTKKDLVPLADELLFLKNYIDLQKHRLLHEENVAVQFPSTKELSLFQIQPLILIVFVENIFKHAVLNQCTQPARITITVKDTMLYYTSSNEVHSIQARKSAIGLSESGIGLNNVRERLHLKYHNDAVITTKHSETEYIISAQIPLEPASTHEVHNET